MATLLIQEGTLHAGDVFVAGSYYGRVRAMLNDKGQKIERTRPSMPVEVVGFSDVPEAGEIFIVIPEERMAKQISLHRQEKLREKELSKLSKVSLEELYEQIKKGEVKELNVIIKADVQGSLEAIEQILSTIKSEEVLLEYIGTVIGNVTESDVRMAESAKATIFGFNVVATPKPCKFFFDLVEYHIFLIIFEQMIEVLHRQPLSVGFLTLRTLEEKLSVRHIFLQQGNCLYQAPSTCRLPEGATVQGSVSRKRYFLRPASLSTHRDSFTRTQ